MTPKIVLQNILQVIKSRYFKIVDRLRLTFKRIRLEQDVKRLQAAQSLLLDKQYSAMAYLLNNFEPMLMRLIDEAVTEYHATCEQNHFTVQAKHDIREIYKKRIKDFIYSKK